MKRLFAIILSLCLLLGVLPEAMAATQHTHRWSQWYTEREAACEHGGESFRYCLDCKEYEYKTYPALGHNYQKKIVDQATCDQWGLAEYTCSRCGDKYGDEIEPLGHNWQQKTTKEPTCTEPGQASNVCSRCGQTQQGTVIRLPALGHKWGGWVVDTPSTCVSYGTHYHQCQRCGAKEWERNYADGLGDHDWGEWKVIAQPGVGTTGLEERVCKNDASHKEQREIPAITVVVNVWLEVKPFDVPDYPIEGSEIVSEIIIHNDGNVPITLVDCLLPDQAEGDWKTWEEFAGLVLQPGEIAGYLHGMIVNSKDIAVKEALRTVANTYTYVSASGTVGTGQTNPVQPRYPVLPGGASLKLELSWDPDEGVGKAYLDAPIHVHFKLTNTGAAPIVLDKPLGYYDPSLLEDMTALPVFVFDDTQFYLLDPGATLTFTRVFPVDQDSLDHMSLFGEVSMEGRPMLSEEHLGDYVWSNGVYMEIPLTKEQDGYVLKGVTEHFPGIIYNGYQNRCEISHSGEVAIDYTWADLAPNLEMIFETESWLYSDSDQFDTMTELPAAGDVFYFSSDIRTNENHLGKIDYTQIDPALISCTIPDFSVSLMDFEQVNDDHVRLHFVARYLAESKYVLKGVNANFAGYEFDKDNNSYWPTWAGHSINCTWADRVPETGPFTGFNGLFLDAGETSRLKDLPVAGETYYYHVSIYTDKYTADLYDFTQIDPDQISSSMEGFSVAYVRANYPGDENAVELVFSATYLGEAEFVLKGVTASFAGYELDKESDAYWLEWNNHSIECIWKDQAPGLGEYGTGIGGFYLDANKSSFLTVPPVAGETYYFNFSVYSAEYNQEKFDFTQIEHDLVSCSVEGFSVALVMTECYEDEDGKGVDLTFSATYLGEAEFILKGVTASFAGYELDKGDNVYWLKWSNHSIECIWKDQAPGLGEYGTGIGAFYLDANRKSFLTVPPVEGETYYFNFTVYSAEHNKEKFDFTQIEPDLISCSVEGFSVALVKTECYEEEDGKGVDLTFSATYQGVHPSLMLEVSWAPDEGIGKVSGDTIRERFKLTNTGNVNVMVPARIDPSSYEDTVQPNWYIDYSGVTYTVLKPGWDMEWTMLDQVYPEDVDVGAVRWSTRVFGYVLIGEDEAGESVASNWAYIDIPLTDSEPAIKVPSLKLITTASPMKASYPYAELYGECEVVRIDYVLINNGEVPLVIDKLMERWGDDHETFLPLNILLYPGESYSDYTNVWLVANLITPTSLTAGIAGTVDVEYYAFGRDCDDTDIVLCETTHSPYSFTMEEPGPTGWEIPSESELWIWKYEKEAPTLPEGYQKGEQIVYVLEVVNMSDYVYGSDVEVSGAVLTDNMLGISETLPAIPAGSSVIREYPYTVNDIDVNTGWIYNEASVKWTDPDSGEEMIHETWDLVDTTDKTSLMLKKEIVGGPKNGEYYVEGEEITFLVTAKNNTDKVLPLVFVNEPLLEGDSETLMEINDMQPGAEQGEMFKYKVTEADVSLGYVGNMATSEYEDANGDWHKVASNYVEVDTGKKTPVKEDETPKPPVPPYKPVFGVISDIRITKAQDKEPDNGNYFVEGETIRYAITVKNEGEVPVDADIYDSLAPGSGLIGTVTGLAPNDSKTVYYEYKVTKDDVDATCVVNYALAKWHPQNVWAETVYMSNKVTSPTSEKQPNPDEHLGFTGEGDSCYRMLTDVSEYNEGYLLHLCTEHAAVETEAGEDWQKAAGLWREAVDKEYEKYLEAAEGAARVTVINERLTYYLWIGAYEKQLKLLYPDDPDTVARLVAENLMDRCIDLCAGVHYDGKKPLDSLIGARIMPGPDPAEVCERRILSRDGTEITYAFVLDAKHAATEKNALALVREAELGAGKAAAWARAQQLWQMALDKEVNARYKAANKEDRQVIAMTRRFLDQLVTARTALLELVYNGDSVIVNERIEQMYKEYAIMLCGK